MLQAVREGLVQLALALNPLLMRQVALDLIALPHSLAQVLFKCSQRIARIGRIAAFELQLGDALALHMDPVPQLVDAMIELQE